MIFTVLVILTIFSHNSWGSSCLPSIWNREKPIEYLLYTSENPRHFIKLEDENLGTLNHQRNVVFIIHGWEQTEVVEDVFEKMIEAYLMPHNNYSSVILVKWHGADDLYLIAASNAYFVGQRIATFIWEIVQNTPVSVDQIEITAHSLGAQVASYVSQRLIGEWGVKLKRINGLDPAEFCFLNTGLSKNDAEEVLVLLTSTLSAFRNKGTIAIWAPSPSSFIDSEEACKDITYTPPLRKIFCDHRMSVYLYTRALSVGHLYASRGFKIYDFMNGHSKNSHGFYFYMYLAPNTS